MSDLGKMNSLPFFVQFLEAPLLHLVALHIHHCNSTLPFSQNRIRQANTAAAAFYTKCLVTLPMAGKARSHLHSRNISPKSIREFALGYAPDCYYGDKASTLNSSDPGTSSKNIARAKIRWGEGSLVEYLAGMGFSPSEIIDAGLAVRTKRQSDQGSERSNRTKSSSAESGVGNGK